MKNIKLKNKKAVRKMKKFADSLTPKKHRKGCVSRVTKEFEEDIRGVD